MAVDLDNKLEINIKKQRFKENANEHYYYPSARLLVENLNDLLEMIEDHKNSQRERLRVLRDYYKGYNETILKEKRRKEDHLADHRATHNFAKYVSQFIQGFLVGVPIKTVYQKEGRMAEKVLEMNRVNDADEHNSDLVLDQSIYGRAYELLYRNENDETRFTISDVMNTFVIYDETVERNPIAGVRYIYNRFTKKESVYLYTEDLNYVYEVERGKLELKELENGKENPSVNPFDGVSIIEYENNSFRQGDFEDVLNLIDLYDSAQSDTGNYMQDFNDALLKIIGDLEIDVEQAQNMKEYNILMLKPKNNGLDGNNNQVDADYIYKKYDVQGTEAFKDRVFNNILLFTSIPNLLDDKQSTTAQSGEALKMKLFALSQKRATKERLFKKGLRNRYRLISNMMKRVSEGELDVNEFNFYFTENLPKAIEQELQWFTEAGGRLSLQTLLSQLSFVENVDEELEKIEEENEQVQGGNDYNREFYEYINMNNNNASNSNNNNDNDSDINNGEGYAD